MLEEERGLLVDRMTQNDPLGVQVLLLIGLEERGITRFIRMMNSGRKGRLPLIVR